MITIVEGAFSLPSAADYMTIYGSKSADEKGNNNFRGVKSAAVDHIIEAMNHATTMEEFRDACRALDRVVMWSYWQVPELYADYEPMSYWDKFGIPARAAAVLHRRPAARRRPAAALAADDVVDQGPRPSAERPDTTTTMLSYILKRLLLMVPTLLGVLTVTFIVIQFVPGGPIEQLMAEARIGKGGEGSGYKAGRDSDAKQLAELKKLYGFDKPVQVRYVEMLAELRALRPRAQLHAQQGRVAADQGEAAGLDEPRAVGLPHHLPDLGAAGHRQGGARGLALRRGDDARRADRLRHPRLRARRVPDRAVRRRHVLGGVSAARPDLGQLGRAVVAGAHRRLLLAPDAADDLLRDRELRHRHAADQEHLHRGAAQAVRAGGARQGPVAAGACCGSTSSATR